MPPVTEPLRERVMAAMATQLGTIVAGSTYWVTPVLVTRALLSIKQYAAFPVLGVMRASGSGLPRVERGRGYRHEFRVTVWGYERATETELVGTRLERLWADHVRCLLGDPTLGLGHLVADCRPDGETDTDNGALEPQAWFAQDWLIWAHETIG
jgi:hypothetical protein